MKRLTVLLMLVAALVFSSVAEAGKVRCYKVFSFNARTQAADTVEVDAYDSGDYVIGTIKSTGYSTSATVGNFRFETLVGDTLLASKCVNAATVGANIALVAGSADITFSVGHYPAAANPKAEQAPIGDKLYIIYDPQDSDGGWVTVYICLRKFE